MRIMTSKSKSHKPPYALNILQFIDGSTSEGRVMSDSSTNVDSTIELTAAWIH